MHGLGLKLIAGHAGFRWRDDDPGGLNSQTWFADAVHAAGYRGWVEVEVFNEAVWARPGAEVLAAAIEGYRPHERA